jgi:hypothetical protein
MKSFMPPTPLPATSFGCCSRLSRLDALATRGDTQSCSSCSDTWPSPLMSAAPVPKPCSRYLVKAPWFSPGAAPLISSPWEAVKSAMCGMGVGSFTRISGLAPGGKTLRPPAPEKHESTTASTSLAFVSPRAFMTSLMARPLPEMSLGLPS